MNDKIIKKTQDTLGKIIKKPPLTDKLLSKPPFRFLHDVTTSVIKSTGVMAGLYPDADMTSDHVKDRDAKIQFLEKAIAYVEYVTGKKLAVRPQKIVAGHEPEKTNAFLVAMADAINKKPSNERTVRKVLEKLGGGDAGGAGGEDEGKRGRDRSSDKKRDDDKRDDSSKRHRDRDRDRDKDKDRKHRDRDSRDKSGDEKRSRDRDSKDRDRDRDRDRKHKDRDEKRSEDRRSSAARRGRHHREDGEEEGGTAPETVEAEPPDEDTPARLPRPSSAKGSRRRRRGGLSSDEEDETMGRPQGEQEAGLQPEDDQQQPLTQTKRLARPSSARPAPPKPKANPDGGEDPAVRMGGGKPVTNVIYDNEQSDDDDDNFVVEESGPAHPDEAPAARAPQEEGAEEGEEHGGLVRRMMESKKELEGGSQTAQGRETKQPDNKTGISEAQRRRDRDRAQKEVDKLRSSIQTVTRSALPLGKVLDFLQEDMDAMQKELAKWQQENKEHAVALKREQSITNTEIEPLKADLKELDSQIADQLDKIAAVKCNTTKNDDRIYKMLASITRS